MRLTIKLILLYLLSLVMAMALDGGITFFENNLVGLLSAAFGGIVAGLSIIFGLISTSSGKLVRKAAASHAFKGFVEKLKWDVITLAILLAASIYVPVVRASDIPLIEYPDKMESVITRVEFFASIEIFIANLSIIIIIEIVTILFAVFEANLSAGK